jgi:hypothetical protein
VGSGSDGGGDEGHGGGSDLYRVIRGGGVDDVSVGCLGCGRGRYLDTGGVTIFVRGGDVCK